MSRAGFPTLPWALPMYEHMEQHLMKAAMNESLPNALRRAAEAGLSKLCQYHEQAKKSQFNVVATGMF